MENKTMYVLDHEVIIPVTHAYGGGWNLSVEVINNVIPQGSTLEVSTKQTVSTAREDHGVIMKFSNGFETPASFDNLGRLIACRAIRQVQSQ